MAFLRTDNRDPPPDAVLRERALVAAAQRMAGGAPLSAGPGDAPCDTDRADGPAGPGRPAPHVSAADSEAIERLGARLPGYRIEREIHRGGQGVVYLALQRSTRRRVAIKVMKEGPFASADDRARFEREVRLLARLDHPSIVAIHDSGTAGGCFYIVMNYIEGLSLDAWMRDGDRTIEQTLRLFHDICEAVGAAHVRGIVHRDLKPSNIRVDAQGRPHVLDFGLAKAEEGSRGHGESIMPAMTITGQFVGSLPWSSPEQATGDAGGIDVRSDVYSLGVVLYQMLTGTFPYEVGGSMLEVARRIAHDEPIPPSEAIAQQSRLGRLFGDRGSERIDDEVETIVLKCLSKDRERRYQNAGELARDIGHYLAGEPIEAKRDSLAYVLGKQVKRYRLVVSFAALLVVVMLAGFVSSIVLWQRAEREALRAIEKGTLAEQREAEARQIAEFQQKMLSDINPQRMGQHLREDVMAEAEAAMLRSGAAAEQITARLEQVTAQLAAMNLTNVGVRSIDRNVLAPALVAVDRDFASQPLVQAALLESISKVYLQLGERAEALPLAQRALETRRQLQGNDSPDTLASVHATSVVLYYQLRWPEAEALAREAIDGRRRVLGPDHIDTMRSVDHLNLILFSDNSLEEAEQASRELLAQRRRVLGEDHLETLQSVNAVGGALWKLGRHAEVEPYWIEVMEKRRRLLGERHLDTLLSISNMGLLRKSQRRLTEAEAYFREAIAGYQDVLGDEHPETLGRKQYLGSVLRQQGRLSEAEPYLTEALAGTLSVMSEHSGPAMTASLELTKLIEAQGRYSDAEARYRRSLEVARGAFGNEGHLTLEAIGHLAVFLRARGELVESEALGAELASSARAAHSERLASYLTIHARTLTAMGRFEEAEAELLEAQAMHAARTAVSGGRATIWPLIELYDAWHAAEPGAGHDARADHWRLRLPPRAGSGPGEAGGAGGAGSAGGGGDGGGGGADAPTRESRWEETDSRAWSLSGPEPAHAAPAIGAWGSPAAVTAARSEIASETLADLNFTNIGVRSVDRNVVEPALAAIENEFAAQPLSQATLQLSVARMYRHLGYHDRATPLIERAFQTRRSLLGDDHLETLDAMSDMAALRLRQGANEESEQYARQTLAGVRRMLGDDHDRTISATDHLASVLHASGKLPEAELHNRVALETRRRLLGDDHLDTLESLVGRGVMLTRLGRYAEAEACCLEAVEARRRLLGPTDPGTLHATAALCGVYWTTDRLGEAIPYHRQILEGWRHNCGDEHPETISAMKVLGLALRDVGRLNQAERYLEEAMATSRRVLPPGHRTTLSAMSAVAGLRREQARFIEAEEIASDVLRTARAAGVDPRSLRQYLVRYAQALVGLERFQEAGQAMTEAHRIDAPVDESIQAAAKEVIAALVTHYQALHAASPGDGHDARLEHWRRLLSPRDGEGTGGAAAASRPGEAEEAGEGSAGGGVDADGANGERVAEVGPRAWLPLELDPAPAIKTLGAWGNPGAVAAVLNDTAARTLADLNFTNIGVRSLDRNVVEPALAAVESEFAAQPLTQATLRIALGSVRWRLGNRDMAMAMIDQGLQTRRSLLGDDHPDTIIAMRIRAWHRMTDAESEQYARQALESSRRLYGEEHEHTISTRDLLANVLQASGKSAEAESHNRSVLETRRRTLGADHPDTLESLLGRGVILTRLGRFAEAEECLLEVVESRQRLLGPYDPSTLLATTGLCGMYSASDQPAEALPYRRQLFEGHRRNLGDEHPTTIGSKVSLGVALRGVGRLGEAEQWLEEALAASRAALGPRDGVTINAASSLAGLRRVQGRFSEAEELSVEALQSARSADFAPHLICHYLVRHAQALVGLERFDDANRAMMEAREIEEPAPKETRDAAGEVIAALVTHYQALHAASPGDGHDARAAFWIAERQSVLLSSARE